MGVAILQPFPNLENETGPTIIDFLTKRVVALGAVQVGHFIVDCETYTSVPQMSETGTKQIALVTKGPRFELGDFVIKLESVSMSQTFKGIMVEVEYRPCVIPSNCWDLIREFMQGFMGSHVTNIIPPYFTAPSMMAPNQNKQNDIYQPIDAVQQYCSNLHYEGNIFYCLINVNNNGAFQQRQKIEQSTAGNGKAKLIFDGRCWYEICDEKVFSVKIKCLILDNICLH